MEEYRVLKSFWDQNQLHKEGDIITLPTREARFLVATGKLAPLEKRPRFRKR